MITVYADIEQAQKALMQTSKSMKSIKNGVLRIIAKGTVKALKTAIKQTTVKRSGELLKSYTYGINKKGEMKVHLNYKKNGDKIFPKVYTLNYGKEGTGWKPRSFVQKGEQFVQNGNYSNEIQQYVDKELNKYWSK